MHSKLTTVSMLGATITSLILAGSLASAPPASARGYYSSSTITLSAGAWKIDAAHSHFGPDYSTMVIERASASSGDNAGSNTFVVVTDGKVYLATAAEAFASNGAKKIDYSDWKDMKLVQVGENAQSIDPCQTCLSGLAEKRLTLRFKSVNGGMPKMENVVVFNAN